MRIFLDKHDLSFLSHAAITLKFKMHQHYLARKL